MLSSRAYSNRNKAALAIWLSWVGGFTNVLTYLSCNGIFTSHMTGTSTNFGRTLIQGAFTETVFYACLITAFFLGAVISALMTEGAKTMGKRSQYVLPLAFEAVLLGIVLLLSFFPGASATFSRPIIVSVIATFAMGVQNAAVTKISGGEVRTTHLTGVLTDLGLEGVQYSIWYLSQKRRLSISSANYMITASKHHPSAQRLLVLAAIFHSFIAGVMIGTWTYARMDLWALAIPIVFLLHLVAMDWFKPIADIQELHVDDDPELQAHGVEHSKLPPELSIYRMSHLTEGSRHRAPNFELWMDRIPLEKKVIILIFSRKATFDANAILDLENVIQRLKKLNKKLLFANVTAAQYRTLHSYGFVEKIGRENIFPDLEFAVACAATETQTGK